MRVLLSRHGVGRCKNALVDAAETLDTKGAHQLVLFDADRPAHDEIQQREAIVLFLRLQAHIAHWQEKGALTKPCAARCFFSFFRRASVFLPLAGGSSKTARGSVPQLTRTRTLI